MNFEPFDRLPVTEWAPWWDQTLERWYGEGLPRELTDRYDILEHFGLDFNYGWWFSPRCQDTAFLDPEGDFAEQYSAAKRNGAIFNPPQIDPAHWHEVARRQGAGDWFVAAQFDGFFWFPRMMFGIEPHFYAFYDHPDLMKEMNEDLLAWNLVAIEALCGHIVPDLVIFSEDMSYNHGPMLSKELFDAFLAPFYRQMIPELKKRGIVVLIDSDGDIREPAAWFKEVGADGLLPLERQAGVDLVQLRHKHPHMRFMGGFDKMTMNQGEAAMRAEFERLLPVAAQGGYILGCDHQTPPGVSYADYQLYLKLFREYADKAGQRSRSAQTGAQTRAPEGGQWTVGSSSDGPRLRGY